jgi:hypothetical protein
MHSKAKATDEPKDLSILRCWFCAVVLRLLRLPPSFTTYPDPVTRVASYVMFPNERAISWHADISLTKSLLALLPVISSDSIHQRAI